MTITKPPQHEQVTLCMLDAVESRMSTVPAFCDCDNLPKVGAPIPYHVLDDFQDGQQEFCAPHVGWRALVISGTSVLMAGVSTVDNAYLYNGLKDGKYPEFLLKACNYAERKFRTSESCFSPAVLFVPMLGAHYLWLRSQVDYFLKIPIRHSKPKFRVVREIRIGKVSVGRIDSERTSTRDSN